MFFLKSLNYSFIPFGGLIYTFVYVLAAQTSTGQAGSKFKTVCQRVRKNDSRDFKKISLLYMWRSIMFMFKNDNTWHSHSLTCLGS